MSSERQGLLLRWLFTAGIAFLVFELSRTGIADFLRLEPCAYLDRVQASGKRPDPARLGAARDRLALAREFDPDNLIVHEYLGIVASDLPLRIGYLETARDHYKKALALRPNSGYLWAGMAAISGALLESRPSTSSGLADGAGGVIANDLRDLKQALAYATRLGTVGFEQCRKNRATALFGTRSRGAQMDRRCGTPRQGHEIDQYFK